MGRGRKNSERHEAKNLGSPRTDLRRNMGGLPVRTQKKARPRKHKQLEEYLKHMNILVAIRVLEALPVRAPAPLGGDEGHLTGNWRKG